METLAEVIVKFIDLVEAQFADFRSKLFKILLAVGFFVIALVLGIVAFAMFVYGVYLGFCELMAPFLAAFAVAGIALILGGGVVFCAKKIMK